MNKCEESNTCGLNRSWRMSTVVNLVELIRSWEVSKFDTLDLLSRIERSNWMQNKIFVEGIICDRWRISIKRLIQ